MLMSTSPYHTVLSQFLTHYKNPIPTSPFFFTLPKFPIMPLSPSSPSLSTLLAFLSLFFILSSATKIGRGYRLISVQESPDGGLLGLLQVIHKNYIYGADIPLLQLYVKHETENRLRVHITDAEKKRWEVPYDLLPRQTVPAFKQTLGVQSHKPSDYAGNELIFSYKTDPFSFSITRKSSGETLFETTSLPSDPYSDLVFKDQYIEISTKLPKDASLYGLGENTQPRGIKIVPNDPYTLYTTDVSAINLNADLYGSHPVYMDLRNRGGVAAAHGVLLLNSNGMDVFYRGDSLTYKVIGGVVDLYFFAGASPLAVVDQYTALIGRPAAMPYWAFGIFFVSISLLNSMRFNFPVFGDEIMNWLLKLTLLYKL